MNDNAAANYTPEQAASNSLEALFDCYPEVTEYEKQYGRADGFVAYLVRFSDGERYRVEAQLLEDR